MSGSETRRSPREAGAKPCVQTRSAGAARPRNAKGHFLPKAATLAEPGSRPMPIAPVAAADAAAKPAAAPRKARARRKPKKGARWSAARQRIFLAALSECANVAQSAAAAKISETTVYRKRRESADFRALWEGAMREGVARLEVILLHRALYGVEEEQYYGGKLVGTVRKFSDHLALTVVNRYRKEEAARNAEDGDAAPEPEAPIGERRARLKLRLSEMNKRMGGAG